MAVLMEEQTQVSQSVSTQERPRADAAEKPQPQARSFRPFGAWFIQAGEFILGLLLAFIGLLVRAALTVALLAAPFIALMGTVLLFALMIEGTGWVLRAIGLSP